MLVTLISSCKVWKHFVININPNLDISWDFLGGWLSATYSWCICVYNMVMSLFFFFLYSALILEEIAIDCHNKETEQRLLQEAHDLHLSSLQLAKKAFGEFNVQTAKHYGNLGRLYQSMRKFKVRSSDVNLLTYDLQDAYRSVKANCTLCPWFITSVGSFMVRELPF